MDKALCGALCIYCSKSWFPPLGWHYLVNPPQSTPCSPVLLGASHGSLQKRQMTDSKCFYTFILTYTWHIAIYKNFIWIILTHFMATSTSPSYVLLQVNNCLHPASYRKCESVSHSVMSDFVTSWTVACQAPLSRKLSMQECWVTPWTVAPPPQAPLSMKFSSEEYWSG